MDASPVEPTDGGPTVDDLQRQIQTYVEGIIHYRNLAIDLGAQPDQMLNAFDRRLCETGLGAPEPGYWSQEDQYDECRDLWSLVFKLDALFKQWSLS